MIGLCYFVVQFDTIKIKHRPNMRKTLGSAQKWDCHLALKSISFPPGNLCIYSAQRALNSSAETSMLDILTSAVAYCWMVSWHSLSSFLWKHYFGNSTAFNFVIKNTFFFFLPPLQKKQVVKIFMVHRYRYINKVCQLLVLLQNGIEEVITVTIKKVYLVRGSCWTSSRRLLFYPGLLTVLRSYYSTWCLRLIVFPVGMVPRTIFARCSILLLLITCSLELTWDTGKPLYRVQQILPVIVMKQKWINQLVNSPPSPSSIKHGIKSCSLEKIFLLGTFLQMQ